MCSKNMNKLRSSQGREDVGQNQSFLHQYSDKDSYWEHILKVQQKISNKGMEIGREIQRRIKIDSKDLDTRNRNYTDATS